MTEKQITAYCDRWSLRAGEVSTLRASSLVPGPANLSVVQLICGDPTSAGPGFHERDVTFPELSARPVQLDHQPLVPGSYALVDLAAQAELAVARHLHASFSVLATLPAEPQRVLTISAGGGDIAFTLEDGQIWCHVGDSRVQLRDQPLVAHRWYQVSLSIDVDTATMRSTISTARTASPARDLHEPALSANTAATNWGGGALARLVLGGPGDANSVGGDFDGRLAGVQLTIDGLTFEWGMERDMSGRTLVETRHGLNGQFHQLPTRAVTGPSFDGTNQRWTDDPRQWNATHFHKEDIYDAGWAETASVVLPPDLPSGIYAFKIETDDEVDRVPFFVRPAIEAPTADVALLMSSATYLAYANHRMLFEGADFIPTKSRLRPEHDYVRRHRELGRSMYEKHRDQSGVMFSSRLRPVLNLRPGADGWNFTPDTDLNAFLHHSEIGHDIIADEDLHAEGAAALAPYRVIVTCSHPEYWSTAMLDALETWQRDGGRLMYLGGNGFYWRVAFSDDWPGAMELRRAEDGVRNWQPGHGESYHAWGGEYGGMWRRNGRAPNELVGVGFAAQGFGRATWFDVNQSSLESRAAWIFKGVEFDDNRIGTTGLGGGAAGQEVDRYDTGLGSPEHAVVLASATTFGPDMVRTKEEFEGSVVYPTPDPFVRADIVFFETPNGGAVFSVGSISWFGALARNGYDNDVAQMTRNVLERFADAAPIPEPPIPEPRRAVSSR